MKLAEKGRFAPPPTLEGAPAQRVAETIAGWDGVHARTHWLLGDEREVDGADFYVGEQELGHIHLDSEAHIFVSKVVADALVKADLALPFQWSRHAVVFEIRTVADVKHALWLFQLSFDRRQGTTVAELLARVADHAKPGKSRSVRLEVNSA